MPVKLVLSDGMVVPAADVAETLASMYAFGIGDDPVGDNRFVGPSYDALFPLVGGDGAARWLYEKAVSIADNTIPADVVARYGPLGNPLTFRGDLIYLPGYSGDLSGISGVTWISEQAFATADEEGSWYTGDGNHYAMARDVTYVNSGVGEAVTSPVTAAWWGSMHRRLMLLAELGEGLNSPIGIAEDISGYGQHSSNQTLIVPGVMPQEITHLSTRNIDRVLETGDGTGWLVMDDDITNGGNQVGLLAFACTDIVGYRWAWSFETYKADQTGLQNVMTIGPDVVNLVAGSTIGGVAIAPVGSPSTLASSYAFGVGDNPTADNRFVGPSYDATFPLGGGAFVGRWLFEKSSAPVDSRIPADIVARYGSSDVGTEQTFRGDLLYTTGFYGFIGSFGWINAQAFSTDEGEFWNPYSEDSPVTLVARDETYVNYSFGGVVTAPVNSSVGTAVHRKLSLAPTPTYAAFGAIGDIVEDISSHGQHSTNLQPAAPGIVPQEITYLDGRGVGGYTRAEGDGTGWLVYDDSFGFGGGNQVGLLRFACVNTDSNLWAWAFQTFNGDSLQTRMTIGPSVVDLIAGSTVGGAPISTGYSPPEMDDQAVMGNISGDTHVPYPLNAAQLATLVNANPLLKGPNLTDASATVNPGADHVSEYMMPAATMTAARTVTLGVGGTPQTALLVTIVRRDLTANTLAIANGGTHGGTLLTFAASPTGVQYATFFYNSADYVLTGFGYLAS
jgi:hypothetical protein